MLVPKGPTVKTKLALIIWLLQLCDCPSYANSRNVVASSPGHSQILSRSHGEKSGEGLVPILCHGPEIVDSVRNVDLVS